MCGIVGYVGPREAAAVLVEGLSRLEYRGYDSAGVAVLNGRGVETRKLAGRIPGLRELLACAPLGGSCGIGHTRWATHGAPTERNAHPHTDCQGSVAVVHNGIIENAELLRARLEAAGHRFVTETDTETVAHLIEESSGGTLEERVIAALEQIEGTYGLAVISDRDPQKIVVARRGSPVLLGIGSGEYLVASDASAVLPLTRSVVYLDDGDIAVVTASGHRIIDREAREQSRAVNAIEWDLETLGLGGYRHFMLKEICEQTETVRSTLRGRLLPGEGTARLNGLNLTAAQCARIERIVIVACGTSWHAGLVGRHYIEELAAIPVSVEYASEYRYRRQLHIPGTLTIVISQSGETADTLEALRAAKAAGSTVIGLVNVVGSTIAREADGGIYLHAGPEIGVASTKAFTAQVVALLLLGLWLGRQRGVSVDAGRAMVTELLGLPDLVARALQVESQVRALAERHAEARNALYLGRGVNFPVALEGALKLKEISYIHAEGYPAAEMKHGPIALIDENMPVVFIAPHDSVFDKVTSNVQEVKARGGRVIALTSRAEPSLAGKLDFEFRIPETIDMLYPILAVVPLQLLAYYMAAKRGLNVDQPRNL